MNSLKKDFLVNGEPPRVCLVGLHGLGSDGHDMMSIMNVLDIGKSFTAICPTAKAINITINGGMPCNAWFDILDIEKLSINYEGLMESVNDTIDLLDGLVAEYDEVFLIGFSQGGAIALTTGLVYDKKIAGVAGISTFFPNGDEVIKKVSAINKNTQVLLTHGLDDGVVDIKFANDALIALENGKIGTELKTYTKLHHAIDNRVVNDINDWFKNIFKMEEKIEEKEETKQAEDIQETEI